VEGEFAEGLIIVCVVIIVLEKRGKVLGRFRAGLVSGVWVLVLFVAVFGVVLNVPLVWGSGTIYIRADGSIEPPDAPISTFDNVTYTLTGNITSDADGILVERSNIIIDGNGYELQGSGYPTKGFTLSEIENVTIERMNIESFYIGVYLNASFHIVLTENNITGNTYGVCGPSSNNTLFSNQIASNEDGVVLEGNHNVVHNNNITKNRFGCIVTSANNTIFRNNITNNTDEGIRVEQESDNKPASYNNIFGNNITNNGNYGIVLIMTNNNNVYGNTLSEHAYYGIAMYSYGNNTIVGNLIIKNQYGLSLSSDHNKIYHNNFVNNTSQVEIYGGVGNIWDNGYPSGGNYWSDYADADLYRGPFQNETGSDGIGDIPYPVGDRYPLMSPWPSGPGLHELKVTLRCRTILPLNKSISLEATVSNDGICNELMWICPYLSMTHALALLIFPSWKLARLIQIVILGLLR